MRREDLISNIGKKIFLRLKNNYFYRGVLLDVTEDALKFKDIKHGEMIISLPEILIFNVDNGY